MVKFSIYLNRLVFVIMAGNVRSVSSSITKTRLFKYIENFLTKNKENFQIKNSDNFHISAQNMDCGTR